MAHAGGGGWIPSKQMRVEGGVIWVQTLSAQLRDPLVVPRWEDAIEILKRNDGTIVAIDVRRMAQTLRILKAEGFIDQFDNWFKKGVDKT